jgi:hypothetical protein
VYLLWGHARRKQKIDEAVLALFRALDLKKFEGFDRVVADDVALACMERFIRRRKFFLDVTAPFGYGRLSYRYRKLWHRLAL